MFILAVDTSTRAGSLAVLRDDSVISHVASLPGEPYSTRMFSDLDRILSDTGLTLPEFDLFAVGAGPGSFTGLRVGITAVKAWADLFGKPVVPVSGLEAVAEQIPASGTGEAALLVPVIDARRGQVFGALYERAPQSNWLKLLGEEVVLAAADFLGMVAASAETGNRTRVTFGSPSPGVIREALDRSRLLASEVHQVSGILAPVIGHMAYQRALRGETVNALNLDANYVRRSDAESKWKD